MKQLVIVGLLAAATAQPAAACGVPVFGSSSEPYVAPAPPAPPPPDPQWGLKIVGGLIVMSVLTRFVVKR